MVGAVTGSAYRCGVPPGHPTEAADPVSQLADTVQGALDGAPDGLTVREVMRALRLHGHQRIPRRAVEEVLADDDRFTSDAAGPKARWLVTGGTPAPRRAVHDAPAAAPPVDAARPLDGLALRDWQIDAFAAWAAAGTRGVVEAVTGTGKTRLALAATRAALSRGGRVLVLVPTLDLQDQWVTQVRRFVPEARVGRLGGGGDADLHTHHVVVATPHSAAAVPVDLPAGAVGLLVADEAHRYGAPTWAAALKPAFAMRLALTATYERNDDGLVEVLGPYFGGVVRQYGFAEARRDGVIAPFRIAFAGTSLEDSERERYDAADEQMRRARRALLDAGFPRAPRDLIARAADIVAEAAGTHPQHADATLTAARRFLAAMRARRDVAANAAGKLDVLAALAPALTAPGTRALVFTDTVEQAEQATQVLTARGVTAEEVHGALTDRRRRIRLAQFRNGNLPIVVAPRVLDEGVDVPDADVAIVLAAFRTRRQMIQRLGRVLRRKDDGRAARLLVAYAAGTREDPDDGAHEDFLDEVVGVAEEVARLDADRAPGALAAWLQAHGAR